MKLIIVARRAQGIRRAGVYHPAEAVEHEDGTLTPQQIKILMNDPDLIVTEVREKPPAGNQGKPPAGNQAKPPAGNQGKSPAGTQANPPAGDQGGTPGTTPDTDGK